FGGRRDMFKVLGYRKRLTYRNYYARYKRDSIAGRIVDIPADYTWRSPPEVTDGPQGHDSPFAKAWRDLEKKHRLYLRLNKLDRLAGIGRFGVMLLGARTGGMLSTRLTSLKPENLMYTSIFSELNAKIRYLEDDWRSERFGMPSTYRLDLTRGLTVAQAQPM